MYEREGRKGEGEEERARVRGCEGALRLGGWLWLWVVRAANGRGVNKGVKGRLWFEDEYRPYLYDTSYGKR